MRNPEIINAEIGNRLMDGKVESFYLNGELVGRINVTYLKFNKWIRIVTTDGMTNLYVEDNTIETVNFFGDEEFKYPLEPIEKHFPEFKKFIGKKLIGYKELVLKKAEQMSFGINLYFEDNLNFVIHNQDYPIDRNEYFFKNFIPEGLKEN